MSNPKKITLIAFTLLATSLTCFGGLRDLLGSKTETEDGNAELDLPPYDGIKHTIGVLPFEGRYRWRGDIDLREAMTSMLENTLVESGRFIVVERESLGHTLAEQDLQSSGRAAQASDSAQTGQILSAKYLAKVTIETVEEKQSGGGGGISIKGISVGGSGGKAQININIKVIDSTTSQVKASQRVIGKAGKRGISLRVRDGGFGGNFSGFSKSPMGEAAFDCIAQAVKFLAGEFEEYPVGGMVLMVAEDDSVIIDLGSKANVKKGDRFEVRTAGRTIVHPKTGIVLGREEGGVTGTLEVTDRIMEEFSYCKLIDGELPNEEDAIYAL